MKKRFACSALRADFFGDTTRLKTEGARLRLVDGKGKPLGELVVRSIDRESHDPACCAGDPDDVIHESESPGPSRSQAV